MCSTIPVLRPLYVRIRYNKDSSGGGTSENPSYKLPMYGSGRKYGKLSISGIDNSTIHQYSGDFQKSVIVRTTRNASDEAIARDHTGITVTEDIHVQREPFDRV